MPRPPPAPPPPGLAAHCRGEEGAASQPATSFMCTIISSKRTKCAHGRRVCLDEFAASPSRGVPTECEYSPMKLYVCYGTFQLPAREHPCRTAHAALVSAGYQPEVIRAYGWGVLPDWLNFTRGRREVRRLSGGKNWVPLLVTDDGEVIQGSKKIAAWAADNPARDSKRGA